MPELPRPATEFSSVDTPTVSAKGRLSPWAARWHKPAFIAFLVVWVVNVVLLSLRVEGAPGLRVFLAAFPLMACVTTLLALGRRLPFQNVLTAACIIASVTTGVMAVAVTTGFPFGPIVFNETLGEKLFQTVPWVLPVLWVILVINGRGVARLIMRPWRKTNFYGFWVIGVTCALVVWFDVGLEPFATGTRAWWIWPLGRGISTWYSAPWANFLGWFILVLGTLVFTIPWLINKQPIKQPMDYHPLIVWLLLNGFLALGNAMEGNLWAVGITLAGHLTAAVLAVRGARW